MSDSAEDAPTKVESESGPPSSDFGALQDPSLGTRYVVLEELGRGGMGVVWRAYDPRLAREVALKCLTGPSSIKARDRMIAEARAMASLNHPNVVAVYDVTVTATSVLIAMERVDGSDLSKWLESEPRAWPEVVAMFAQAGRGLSAAHARDLLHRDFKPANVLVSSAGVAKVTDFGLARRNASSSHGDSGSAPSLDPVAPRADGGAVPLLTTVGTVMGTPAFMAPEQHTTAGVDPRADQFAFCAALWAALTGRPPYPDASRAFRDKLAGPPPWPPEVEVPPRIVAALRRGLAPSPDDRWEDLDALLDRLVRDPIPARRRMLGLGAAVVGLVGVSAALAFSPTRCRDASTHLQGIWDPDRRAHVRAQILGTDAPFAPSTWHAVDDGVSAYATRWVERHTAVCEATQRDGVQSAAVMDARMACLFRARLDLKATVDLLARADEAVVERAYGLLESLPALASCDDLTELRRDLPPVPARLEEPVAQIRSAIAEATALLQAGGYAEASERLRALPSSSEALDYRPLRVEIARASGTAAFELGQYAEAGELFRQAYDEALATGRMGQALEALRGLASVSARDVRHIDGAIAYVRTAHAIAEAADASGATVAALHNTTGVVLRRAGRLTEAEDHYRAALELLTDAPMLRSTVLSSLATSLREQGRFVEAEEAAREAVEIRRALLGSEHPELASALANLATAQVSLHNHRDAEANLRTVVALVERSLGPDHPRTLESRVNLAGVIEYQDRSAEAVEILDDVVSRMTRVHGAEHPSTLVARMVRVSARSKLGHVDEGVRELETLVPAMAATFGPGHPNVAKLRHNLGVELLSLGLHERALDELRASRAGIIAASGPEHPDLARVDCTMSQAHLALGRAAEALSHARRCAERFAAAAAPDSQRSEAQTWEARALWTLGRRAEASRVIHEALSRLDPDDPVAVAARSWWSNRRKRAR